MAGRMYSVIRDSRPYQSFRDLVYHWYERHVEKKISSSDIVPRHVGVILDGNRRWARSMGIEDVNTGHRRGAHKISELLHSCTEAGARGGPPLPPSTHHPTPPPSTPE